LEGIGDTWGAHRHRTVRWAIEDLIKTDGDGTFDTASTATTTNAQRIDFLFDNDLYNLPRAAPCSGTERRGT
jgi:DNA (cytosine-5)-methyltransferase 1